MDELLPVKQAGPVVQWIGDECLVFDPRTAQAHLLNSKLAMLYQACDGKQRIETMAERLAEKCLAEPRAVFVRVKVEKIERLESGSLAVEITRYR